jgi:hypothetical protein
VSQLPPLPRIGDSSTASRQQQASRPPPLAYGSSYQEDLEAAIAASLRTAEEERHGTRASGVSSLTHAAPTQQQHQPQQQLMPGGSPAHGSSGAGAAGASAAASPSGALDALDALCRAAAANPHAKRAVVEVVGENSCEQQRKRQRQQQPGDSAQLGSCSNAGDEGTLAALDEVASTGGRAGSCSHVPSDSCDSHQPQAMTVDPALVAAAQQQHRQRQQQHQQWQQQERQPLPRPADAPSGAGRGIVSETVGVFGDIPNLLTPEWPWEAGTGAGTPPPASRETAAAAAAAAAAAVLPEAVDPGQRFYFAGQNVFMCTAADGARMSGKVLRVLPGARPQPLYFVEAGAQQLHATAAQLWPRPLPHERWLARLPAAGGGDGSGAPPGGQVAAGAAEGGGGGGWTWQVCHVQQVLDDVGFKEPLAFCELAGRPEECVPVSSMTPVWECGEGSRTAAQRFPAAVGAAAAQRGAAAATPPPPGSPCGGDVATASDSVHAEAGCCGPAALAGGGGAGQGSELDSGPLPVLPIEPAGSLGAAPKL